MRTRQWGRALAVLAALRRHERKSAEWLRAYQTHRLRRVLRAARAHPFYRRSLDSVAIPPERFSIPDLARLPILEKEELRREFPEQWLRSQRPPLVVWHTTGSTGKPLAVGMNEVEIALSEVHMRYGFMRSGLSARQSLCWIMAVRDRFEDRTLFQRLGLGRQYQVDLRRPLPEMTDLLEKLAPDALYSYPSFLLLLAKHLRSEGRSLPSVSIIFSQGEVLPDSTRAYLGSAFGATVRDTYGSSEIPRVAYECGQGRLHIIPHAAIVEVVDKDESGVGHALITSLYHKTMPLIRYRIGDRMWLGRTPCPCGDASATIEHIEGRDDDVLVLPSGRLLSARAINLREDVPGLLDYQIIQRAPERFEVHVRKGPGFTPQSAARIRVRILSGCLGEQVKVDIVEVPELVRASSGKLRSVVSEVQVDAKKNGDSLLNSTTSATKANDGDRIK